MKAEIVSGKYGVKLCGKGQSFFITGKAICIKLNDIIRVEDHQIVIHRNLNDSDKLISKYIRRNG